MGTVWDPFSIVNHNNKPRGVIELTKAHGYNPLEGTGRTGDGGTFDLSPYGEGEYEGHAGSMDPGSPAMLPSQTQSVPPRPARKAGNSEGGLAEASGIGEGAGAGGSPPEG